MKNLKLIPPIAQTSTSF